MKSLLVAASLLALTACHRTDSANGSIAADAGSNANAASAAASNIVTEPSGVAVETLTPGAGPHPRMGDQVMVTYEGRLANGTLFDSSTEPVSMTVGDLVPGFNEGLALMQKGGRYRLFIPADLGYGAEGSGGAIPPNADLTFIVTLVDLTPATRG